MHQTEGSTTKSLWCMAPGVIIHFCPHQWNSRVSVCNSESSSNGCRPPGRPRSAYRLQPEAVQVWSPLLLGERDQPASATLVPLVLPHGLDAVLQQNISVFLLTHLQLTAETQQQRGVSQFNFKKSAKLLRKAVQISMIWIQTFRSQLKTGFLNPVSVWWFQIVPDFNLSLIIVS